MRIHIPNAAWLNSIDPFLEDFDPKKTNELKIIFHKKWMSIHPMVLSMIASLGMRMNPKNIKCEKLEAKSKNYLERMGLFDFLGIKSGIKITKHESTGRFVPLTPSKTTSRRTFALCVK